MTMKQFIDSDLHQNLHSLLNITVAGYIVYKLSKI